MPKNPKANVYKVTGTVYVEANNVRHAAHVAKGTFQMKDNGPAIFVVEERSVLFGNPYLVDLDKSGHAVALDPKKPRAAEAADTENPW